MRRLLGGYEVDKNSAPRVPWAGSREALAFPDFYATSLSGARPDRMVCTSPVTYKGHAQLRRDIDNLKAAMNGTKVEAFMPAISPANIEDWMPNAYYKKPEDYLFAVAEAMHEE